MVIAFKEGVTEGEEGGQEGRAYLLVVVGGNAEGGAHHHLRDLSDSN